MLIASAVFDIPSLSFWLYSITFGFTARCLNVHCTSYPTFAYMFLITNGGSHPHRKWQLLEVFSGEKKMQKVTAFRLFTGVKIAE